MGRGRVLVVSVLAFFSDNPSSNFTKSINFYYKISPGLMEEDFCSRGHGFQSQHRILNGHFYINFCWSCNFCLKRPKINENEAWDGPFYIKKTLIIECRFRLFTFRCLEKSVYFCIVWQMVSAADILVPYLGR